MPGKAGKYNLLAQFEYRDPEESAKKYVVPADTAAFETDLASIPFFATWLVPKDGTHTPAALLHDALMPKKGKCRAYIGPPVTRLEADVVFRQAMEYLGVPFIRRWLMWAVVTMASLASWMPDRRFIIRLYYMALVGGALVFFGVGAFANVLDLVDVKLHLPWIGKRTPTIPWMAEGTITQELAEVARWTGIAVIVSAPLWIRHLGVYLLAAAGLTVFGLPIVVAMLGYVLYWIPEAVIFAIGNLAGMSPPPPRILRGRFE